MYALVTYLTCNGCSETDTYFFVGMYILGQHLEDYMKYMLLFPPSPSRRVVMLFGIDLPATSVCRWAFSVVHVVISILWLPHVPCMRDTFPCVCKYVVLSNTDLNIIRSLSARLWPAGTGHSVLLLLSSPSKLTQYTSSYSAGVKLTQWTSSCVYYCCQAHTVDDT